MSCRRIAGGFICSATDTHRLRLADGGYVFMAYHAHLGPMFFCDRAERRELITWYEDPLICQALDWFCQRGHRC